MGNLDVNFRLQAGRDIVAGGNIISNCVDIFLPQRKTLIFLTQPKKDGDSATLVQKVHQMMCIIGEELLIEKKFFFQFIGRN